MDIPDSELVLLEAIHAAENSVKHLTQRDLAKATGLSLGMTNALLKRFSDSGLVKLTYHSAKSVQYELSPAGVAEMGKRAAGSLEATSRGGQIYRNKLEAFISKAKAGGATTLVLAGQSELSFTIERICEDYGLVLVRSADPERAKSLGKRPGVVLVDADAGKPEIMGAVSLTRIITGRGTP
jgi:DNA-binding MarR family transcriptional regulator